MKASLQDIEQAVRANFVINPDGKFLETGIDYLDRRLKSGARMIFIGVAIGCGHRVSDILRYVQMDLREFNNLLAKYHSYNDMGKEKYDRRKKEGKRIYDQAAALDVDLRIYRKCILINNYILNLKRQRVNML